MSGADSEHRTPPAIPDHEMLRRIGRGSYGEVWLARNVMGVYRAVKVVYRDRFESERPFEREFEGIRKFEPVSRSHESQVNILHVGRQNGYFYYVMELADDARESDRSAPDLAFDPEAYTPKTLHEVLKQQGRLPFAVCLEVAVDLTTALGHLHANRLVHRDVKPSNIIFVNGIPKLADIGLVTATDATLSFVGTEGFLPPEGPGTPQADLYGLGKVLYEMTTGRDRMDYPELPTYLREETDREGFSELNEVILKACDTDASRRYQNAEQMLQDLLLIRAGRSLRRARTLERHLAVATRLGSVFLAVALLLFGAYFYQQRQTREARRLALVNQELAQKEAEHRKAAEAAVGLLELQKIERMMETGEGNRALARLAHRLRVNPEDKLVARRLLTALTYRDYAIPLAELRHEAVIMDADISPDGRHLVTGTSRGEVVFWDLELGKEIGRDWAGEYNFARYRPGAYIIPILNVQFDSSGTRVVVPGGRAGAARIWDLTDELSLTLEIEDPGTNDFLHAEFSPDGKRVAAMARSGAAFVWDATTGERQVSMVPDQDLRGTIVTCRFTADGARLITANCSFADPTLRGLFAWDSGTGELINRHDDRGFSMGAGRLWREPFVLDPSRPRLAYNRGGGFFKVWDYESGELITGRENHEWPIGCVTFSPHGRLAASGGNDQTVRLWDVGENLRLRHSMHQPGRMRAIAFDPSGELMATGSDAGTFQLWNPYSGQPVGEPLQHAGPVRHLEFTPTGERLVSYNDHSAWIWDIRPGAARPVLLANDSHGDRAWPVNNVEFTPDGDYLLTYAGGAVGTAEFGPGGVETLLSNRSYGRVWDPGSGNAISPEIPGNPGRGTIVANDEGWRLVAGHGQNYINVQRGIQRHEGIGIPGMFLALSPNSRWALFNEYSGQSCVWDIHQDRRHSKLRELEPLVAGAFDAGSARVFLVSVDGRGRIFRLDTGETMTSIDGLHVQWPPLRYLYRRNACWSPDGRWVGFAHGARARLYDAITGKPLADWLMHDNAITDIHFSHDSRYFLTASIDQTAKVWDVGTGRQASPTLVHDWLIYAAAFSQKGENVGTASWDKNARVWVREFGLPLTDPLPHPDWVIALDFHPSGRWLATGCTDGAARVWELPQASGLAPEWLPELAEGLAGFHVTEADSLEHNDGQRKLLALRKRFEREPSDHGDEYVRWGQWFFADRRQRAVSPSAGINLQTHSRRLELMETLTLDPHQETFLRLAPTEPRHLARLGYKMVTHNHRDWVPDLDRAEWLTRLAVERDPQLPMAWWARAEVLRTTGHPEQAIQAVEQSLNLDPREPNAWLVKALLSRGAKSESETYEAIKRAVQLARNMAESPSTAEDRYLDPLLRLMASVDLSNTATLNRWIQYSEGNDRTDRFRMITDWLTALALDEAPEELKPSFADARVSFLASAGKWNPVIVDQSRRETVVAGKPFELRVKTQTDEPLQFKWYFNDEFLTTTRQGVLVVTNAGLADAGSYRVLAQAQSPLSRRLQTSSNIVVRVQEDGWVYGALKREIWNHIPGSHLTNLTSSPRFADPPDEVDWIGMAEFQISREGSYGARISGWLIPPVAGEYRFYFLSDDAGLLKLSTNAAPDNAVQIASELSWNRPRSWEEEAQDSPSDNVSKPMLLAAGQPAYLEALVKQGDGDAYFGIAWQMPGEPPPKNGAKPIPGRYFAQPAAGRILSSAAPGPASN